MPGTSPYFNVRDYGAVGDGKTDDAAAINAAVSAAASSAVAPSGNVVFLPAGNYLVSSAITVLPGVALRGAGWNTPGAGRPFLGSWVFVAAGASFSPVTVTGSGGSVRDLGFNVHDQSTTAPPVSAAPMVLVSANNALVENLCLYNPYGGVSIDGGAQASLRRLFGQPLSYGVRVDRSQDSNYIDTLHFWPYWQPAGSPVGAFQLANGTAVQLLRCDNPHISNVFGYNYATGLGLYGSAAGTPHKVHLMNADFDGCVTGVNIAAPGAAGYAATMQMNNVTIQSPSRPGAPKGHGIWVQGGSSYALVQATNVRVAHSGLNAICIDADNVRLYADNLLLEQWAGDAGFRITSPTSFAWLGAGFACTPGGTPYAPSRQFHIARFS